MGWHPERFTGLLLSSLLKTKVSIDFSGKRLLFGPKSEIIYESLLANSFTETEKSEIDSRAATILITWLNIFSINQFWSIKYQFPRAQVDVFICKTQIYLRSWRQ